VGADALGYGSPMFGGLVRNAGLSSETAIIRCAVCGEVNASAVVFNAAGARFAYRPEPARHVFVISHRDSTSDKIALARARHHAVACAVDR